MRLIGITGRARAGKDTFAQGLIRLGYQRRAFADPLKEVTAKIANEESHLYFDDATKEEYTDALEMTRRQALQKVGVGMRDSLGPDTWVRRLLREWVADGMPSTVITDVRFDNEALAVLKAGGHIVRILRPDNVGLSGEAAQHVSEAGVSEHLVDVDITNDGTVGELWEEARRLHAIVTGDMERV